MLLYHLPWVKGLGRQPAQAPSENGHGAQQCLTGACHCASDVPCHRRSSAESSSSISLASLGSAFIVAALDYLHCQMSGGDDSSAGAWTAAHARTPDLIGTSRWCQSPVSD
mmetsp:Transcript_44172/g.71854  ORF Transcript_44172/g.71854 Transcript_44172/m.71854 type:complete len:111 (+) Transcript_44172:71-403(+)